jgi:hypothetical protein
MIEEMNILGFARIMIKKMKNKANLFHWKDK